MKLPILKHMKSRALYFREELESFSKRIDFELGYLLNTGEITKHYQGIYSTSGSLITNEDVIAKILKRDRSPEHLIIPGSRLTAGIDLEISEKDFICLNHKRSDQISTATFKIKFQIPTHGFPKKLTSNFLTIYQMNISQNAQSILNKLPSLEIDEAFLKDAKKYANKRTYKIVINTFETSKRYIEISSELGQIGAPLILKSGTQSRKSPTSIEHLLADAFEIGMEEPRIHNILPFTVLKNADSIDFKKLQKLTKENGSYRYAGFILELLKRAGYESIPEFKAPKYHAKPKILFKSSYGKRGISRLMSNHLDFAFENWGILIDTKIDSERDKIRKWS